MEYLSAGESAGFIDGLRRDITLNHPLNHQNPLMKKYSFRYPAAQDLFSYSYAIACHCIHNNWGFMMITNDSVYPSSVNSHLYYALRRSYGDARSIHSAPGHLFFKHEKHDMASFISIAVMNLYDCVVLSDDDEYRFSLSNDERLGVYTEGSMDWMDKWRIHS